jgi:iron complex outermembrane receptor protein
VHKALLEETLSVTSPTVSPGVRRFPLPRFPWTSLTATLLLACRTLYGQEPSREPDKAGRDLTQVSMEGLMNLEVTSASKKEQKLSQVPAALFVITQEDIGRSGATNIPDLLRMVPGMDVAQINANTWAVSARGLNSEFAGELLVLVDGRAVYTPLLAGVNWDTLDVPLEDIERIEVIRGPGGTVWGANAVNGVINIITKKAWDTQGALVTVGGGTHTQELGTAQLGGKINADTSYRVFAKYLDNGHFPDLNGANAQDDWRLLHGGFRADSSVSKKDSLTIQGDLYTGGQGNEVVHTILSPPNNVTLDRLASLSGGDLLGRWSHVFSDRSDLTAQFYFDQYTRSGPQVREARHTFDFDFQHHLALGERHDLIWGAGYRHTADETLGTIDETFIPANWAGELFNLFAQDQVTLKPNCLFLYAGTKLENSYFTGFDIQPSLRLAWTPDKSRTLWGAVSRATRTPDRRDVNLSAALAALPGPAEVLLVGNPNLQSEHVIVYEAGYRAQPTKTLSIDVAAFFSSYHGLQTIEPLSSFIDANSQPPILVLPQTFANKLHGTTDGVEVSVSWKATDRWIVSPGYALLQTHLHTDPTSLDTTTAADEEGSNPRHQAQLRSHFELWRNLAWDANAYFVGRLPAQAVVSYTRVDTQLTWRFAESMEASFVGQNLLRDHHVEFNDDLATVNSSQIKRSAYAKITWRF